MLSCYLCRADLTPAFKKGEITLYRCKSCSLLQIAPADFPASAEEFYSDEFLSSPNSGALSAKLMRSHWAFMTPPEHIYYFSRKTLEQFLREEGFTPLDWMTRGKWANLGFLSLKVVQMFPGKLTERVSGLVKRSPFSSFSVYVPSADVQYIGARQDAGAQTVVHDDRRAKQA